MKIDKEIFKSQKGDVAVYTLTNIHGCKVRLSSIGAGVLAIEAPDRNGKLSDVVLGYKNVEDYFYDGPCAGKVPGRYANRIAKGEFAIDGVKYQLRINNGPNALHGGPEGFCNQIWNSEVVGETVVFSLFSADGFENYPGNMIVKAKYTFSDDNELTLELSAVSDKKTIVNLTNHTYFNLAGEDAGTVLNHTLTLACSHYLSTDDTLIPTGEVAAVAGTPMDFTTAKKLGAEIKCDFPALNYGKGYDNCWVVDDWTDGEVKKVATLHDEASGRVLEVLTSQPAVQVYTGNWLEGCPQSVSGHNYHDYDGVAIECQGMPDAPNHDNFPCQELSSGSEYKRIIKFKFSTK